VVMDAFTLSVKGNETRVNAHEQAYEYMAMCSVITRHGNRKGDVVRRLPSPIERYRKGSNKSCTRNRCGNLVKEGVFSPIRVVVPATQMAVGVQRDA